MDNKHLIYISNPYLSSVVESQVYQLLEYFMSNKIFDKITLIQIYNNRNNFIKTKSVLERYTFDKVFVRGKIGIYLKINPINSRISGILKKILNPNQQHIIHTRTEIIGYYTINALNKINKRLNVLIDFRGTTKEEINFRIDNGKKSFYLILQKHLYTNILKVLKENSNIIFSSVSNGLKRYLIEDLKLNNRIFINPNIANSSFEFDIKLRNSIRKKFGIADSQLVIVVSSSGGEIWQNECKIIGQFLNDRNFFIFNLSPIVFEGDNVINKVVPFNEMPGMLSAADIGLVWRENHILNKCASPSKFSEYATTGLYVITNNSVDLIDTYIKNHKSGYSTLIPDGISKHILSDKSIFSIESRIKRAQAGIENFGIENVANSYSTIYKNMLKKMRKL